LRAGPAPLTLVSFGGSRGSCEHPAGMHFEIIGPLRNSETIATGHGIRELARLRKAYGPGRWRKRKADATIQLAGGLIRDAEVHWYEASGIGRVEFKIKRFL